MPSRIIRYLFFRICIECIYAHTYEKGTYAIMIYILDLILCNLLSKFGINGDREAITQQICVMESLLVCECLYVSLSISSMC